MSTDKNTIKNWFKTGLKPTQTQFWSTWDSFWHKSESLPISSISGLGNLLDGKAEENHEHNQYATNDAVSLTADNVTAWQQKLGVADLKFDDKAITTTQDYADFGLQSGATINSFNNAVYEAITGGEFGKNFSNTDLEITENRKHTGTASVELAIPMIYSNASQRFSGLIDKSSDATYNRLLGMDANGNVNEVGLPALTNEMSKSTDAQKDAWRLAQRKTGETYSVGQPRVDFINPPVIDSTKNYNQYVTIVGINLFLNPETTQLRFRHKTTGEIKQITNFQTQQTNAKILVIGELFTDWATGEWEVLINNNGNSNIVNNITLEITENLISEPINLTWENVKVSDDSIAENITTTPNSVNMSGSTTQGLTVHSSVLVSETDKEKGCTVTMDFTGASKHNLNSQAQSNYYVGFIGSNDQPLLTSNVEVGFQVKNTFESSVLNFLPSNTETGIKGYSIVDTIYFMFKGNICTMYFFQGNKLQVVSTNALKGDLGLKIYRNQATIAGGNLNLNISTKYVNNN